MVSVMQVDRHFVPAERGSSHRQVVMEPNDGRLSIPLQACRSWIPTIEAPNVSRRIVRVERMEAGSRFQFVGKVCRGELGPAWMRRPVSFAGCEVRKLGWLRI